MFAHQRPPSGTVRLAIRGYSRIAGRRGGGDELAFSADRLVPANSGPAGEAAWMQAVAMDAFECDLPDEFRDDLMPCARCGRAASLLMLQARRVGEGEDGPLHAILALAAPNCQREDCERAIGDAFAAKAQAFFDVPVADGMPPFDVSSLDHASRAAHLASLGDNDVITTSDSDASSFGVFAAKITAGGPGPIALCFVRFLDLGPSAEASRTTLSDYVLVQAVPEEIAAHAGSDTLATESFALESASKQVDRWGVAELLQHRDLRCHHCGGACEYFLSRQAAYPVRELHPEGAFPVVAAVGVFAAFVCASPDLQPGLPDLPEGKEAALQRALVDGQRALGKLAGCIPLIEQRHLRDAGLCAFPGCLAGPPAGSQPWPGCTACRSAKYCCREHQERDWDRHKPACGGEAPEPPRDREGFRRWMMGES